MTDKSKNIATSSSLQKQLSISSSNRAKSLYFSPKNLVFFLDTTNCSLYRTSKILISTKTEGNFCAFCHEICKKAQPEVSEIVQDSPNKCSCDHEGDKK